MTLSVGTSLVPRDGLTPPISNIRRKCSVDKFHRVRIFVLLGFDPPPAKARGILGSLSPLLQGLPEGPARPV